MAFYVLEYGPSSYTGSWNGSPRSGSRNAITRVRLEPDKVRGAWITFENGSKFRRATAYERSYSQGRRGANQQTSGTYSGTPAFYESTPGGYYYDLAVFNNTRFQGGVGFLVNFYGQTNGIPVLMKNESVTKALLKIADEKAGIGEDLLTFRQTLNLIRDPASALIGLLKAAKNRKEFARYLHMRGPELLRRSANGEIGAAAYLQYVYGWIPLLSDIHGTMSFLKDQGKKKTFLLHGKGSSSQEAQTKPFDVTDPSGSTTTHWNSGNENVVVRTNLWARIDPTCPGLRSLNQFGLINPLSLIWELTPYSFVIDWMLPIGSVLRALTAPAGLLFVDGSIAGRGSLTLTYSHWSYVITNPPGVAKSHSPANGLWEMNNYYRITLNGWPAPGLWYNSKPFAGEKNDRPLKALALSILALGRIR